MISSMTGYAVKTCDVERGTLQIESRPEGAVVLSAGRPIGVTPYCRVAWAELHQLELRHPGYRDGYVDMLE